MDEGGGPSRRRVGTRLSGLRSGISSRATPSLHLLTSEREQSYQRRVGDFNSHPQAGPSSTDRESGLPAPRATAARSSRALRPGRSGPAQPVRRLFRRSRARLVRCPAGDHPASLAPPRPGATRSSPCDGGCRLRRVARSCLLAYKERGRRDLARPLAVALAAAIGELGDGPIWLVPVPPRAPWPVAAAASMSSGWPRHAARILRRRGVAVRVVPVLALTADRPDATELTAAERGIAAVGKFVARPVRVRPLRSTRVMIVDDLVTTGNTVAAAAAALRAAHCESPARPRSPAHNAEVLGARKATVRYDPLLSGGLTQRIHPGVDERSRVGQMSAGYRITTAAGCPHPTPLGYRQAGPG